MRVASRLSRGARLLCLYRPFSSTATRPAAIPEFLQSSSEELDETLRKARDLVIIPKHLSPRESRIVYGTKHRGLFEQEEPVTAQIGGITVQLRPISFEEKISHWYTLKKAVTIAHTKSDWANIERLLEGYNKAGIKLEHWQVNKLVRQAWLHGEHDAVLRLLDRAHETGIRIQSQQLLSTLLWGMRDIAVSNRWARKDLDRAITGARQIADLLESPEHAGGDRAVKPGDLRTLPLTIAAPLELLAVKQVKYPPKNPAARDEAMDEVRQGAGRLLNNLDIYGTEPLTAPMDLGSAERREKIMERRYNKFKYAQVRLLRCVPVWHAITLSKRLLGTNVPQPKVADKLMADIHAIITEAIQTLGEQVRPDANVEENWSIKSWKACEWVDKKK